MIPKSAWIFVPALTLFFVGAAAAQPYRHNNYSHSYGAQRHNDGGALIGLGIGLFALGAIVAASNHDRDYDRGYDRNYDRGYDRYEYAPPPPPPPPAYYGYRRGYGY